jgi:hypothetical protein
MSESVHHCWLLPDYILQRSAIVLCHETRSVTEQCIDSLRRVVLREPIHKVFWVMLWGWSFRRSGVPLHGEGFTKLPIDGLEAFVTLSPLRDGGNLPTVIEGLESLHLTVRIIDPIHAVGMGICLLLCHLLRCLHVIDPFFTLQQLYGLHLPPEL